MNRLTIPPWGRSKNNTFFFTDEESPSLETEFFNSIGLYFKKKFRMMLFAFLFCFLRPLLWSQAWVEPQHHGYLKLGLSKINVSSLHDYEGQSVAVSKYTDRVNSLYLQHGITSRMTLLLYIPYQSLVLEGSPGSYAHLGDILTGMVYGFLQQQWKISGGILLGIPSGDSAKSGGLRTGDNEWNIEPRVNLGRSWQAVPLFLEGMVAYNFRTRGNENELKSLLKLGLSWKSLIAIGFIDIKQPLPAPPDYPTATGLYARGQSWIAPGGELILQLFNKFYLSAATATILKAKNVAAGKNFSAGVGYRY